MPLEQLQKSVFQAFQESRLIVQHDGPLVRADVDVVSIGIELDICKDERRLCYVERLVHLVDGFGNLGQIARSRVYEEHLPIWSLSALANNGP